MGVIECGYRFAPASCSHLGKRFPQDEDSGGEAGIVSVFSASPIEKAGAAGEIAPVDYAVVASQWYEKAPTRIGANRWEYS